MTDRILPPLDLGESPKLPTSQLEALPPNRIAELLQDAITDEANMQQLAEGIALETDDRRELAYLITAGGAG
jgi:hypothetical protein